MYVPHAFQVVGFTATALAPTRIWRGVATDATALAMFLGPDAHVI